MNKRFTVSQEQILDQLRSTLMKINPDVGYGDWIAALMVVFNETRGSDEGLALADEWSSHGKKYRGLKDVEYRWNHFNLNYKTPIGMRTLLRIASR